MKPFRSISVVKYPRELVWATVRDHLPDLVPLMDDIRQITQLRREEGAEGIVCLDNLWQADPKIPTLLKGELGPDKLSWIDRAEWRQSVYECHWKIEPRFLPELVQCFGLTKYEPAMGGRGTRITFEGQVGVNSSGNQSLPAFVDASLLRGFEGLVGALIPNNLRKLAVAVEKFLDSSPA